MANKDFPINSRSGWVHQQHLTDARICVAYEVLPVGPGAYSPSSLNRHISTPSLGKSRDDPTLLTYKSPLRSYSMKSSCRKLPHGTVDEEFSTIFHEHDERMAIDPRLRFCATPGPKLGHDSVLYEKNVDGIRIPSRIHFGPNDIPFGDRNIYKLALPDYDVKYDSEHLRPREKLGVFPKTIRFKHYEKKQQTSSSFCANEKLIKSGESMMESQHSSSTNDIPQSFTTEQNSSSVVSSQPSQHKTIKKKKREPELKFDDSCYQKLRQKVEVVEQNPRAINTSIKANAFYSAIAVPSEHYSRKIDMEILNRLKKYS